MNKTTNFYRRCAYCPHHSQTKPCCCRNNMKSISTKSGKRIKHSHNKSKKN